MDLPVPDPPLFQTMHTMRSMRRLRRDPVPFELIDVVLDSAIRAPNGGNVQPWHFLVIVDPEVRHQMGEIYRRAWDDYFQPTRDAAAERDLDAATRRGMAAAEHLGAHFGEAPVHVLVLLRSAIPPEQYPADHAGYYAAIYPAVQNLLLAARGVGLGATLTTLHRERTPEVRQLLGIPDDVEICACVPMGWPQGRFGPVRRRPLDRVAHRDHWDTAWQRTWSP